MLQMRNTQMGVRGRMQIIAMGLESGNPVAYLLLFVIMYPALMVIVFAVIDKLKKR